jgi:hypothetical protein
MRQLFTVAAVFAVVAVAACSGPMPSETASPPPSPTATATPASGSAEAEAALLDGLRADLEGTCVPLPSGELGLALAGIRCTPVSDVASLVTLYLFDTQPELLDAYEARVAEQGIELRTHAGLCEPNRASEGAYFPGDDGAIAVPQRSACYVDGSGSAHLIATSPPAVLILVDGLTGDIADVEEYAWADNEDVPGTPTIWRD